jgi:hypothetical protein
MALLSRRTFYKGPFFKARLPTCNFCCDFSLLMNVKEWMSYECLDEVHILRTLMARSHPSEEENHTRNRSKSCKCKRTYIYTGDFCCDFNCDFLLLEDVKEWVSYKCSRLWNLITTSLSNLLLHILQKEKIATKIAAKTLSSRLTK